MKILAVIIVYNQLIRETTTYRTLIASVDASNRRGDICVIVYDNSRQAQQGDSAESIISRYVHDPMNGGLSTGYNYALDYALVNNCDWLLLLDQDTELSVDFVSTLMNDISGVQDKKVIVAVVPKVFCGDAPISPFFVRLGGTFQTIRRFDKTIEKYEIGAINSGSAVRVSYLEAIGGFNAAFKLDMLDHWLFHTMYLDNKRLLISDTVIRHKLSVQDYSSIDYHRYNSIISAEVTYYKNYRSAMDYVVFKVRLAIRAFKLLLIRKRASLAVLTFKRIFH
ncbi:MAG: glycosyltransferase [Nitrospirota bacterium]